MLGIGTITCVVACGLCPLIAGAEGQPKAPKVEIESLRVIGKDTSRYHGWPTVTLLSGGDLVLGYSGNREQHVCPFGRVEVMRSSDGGNTWSDAHVVWDSDLDDRDVGLIETRDHALLLYTFTSTDWIANLKANRGNWPEMRVARWDRMLSRVPEQFRTPGAVQAWVIRSNDAGKNWSDPIEVPVHVPHGPIQLANGKMLCFGLPGIHKENATNCVYESADGISWKKISEIPPMPGHDASGYCEIHGVQAADGQVIIHIRNETNQDRMHVVLQSESSDGGKTWSVPRDIGIGHGVPMHLLRTGNNTLLTTFGYRWKPYGIRASISTDNGKSWCEPFVIADDGITFDLGYPSTVQLADGSFVTVWYECMPGNPRAQLRQAKWRFKSTD